MKILITAFSFFLLSAVNALASGGGGHEGPVHDLTATPIGYAALIIFIAASLLVI